MLSDNLYRRCSRFLGFALALCPALMAVAADAQTLAHLPTRAGMRTCYLETPIGNEISSLLCLNDGVALLSAWEKQTPEERKWHEDASRGAFKLAQQAFRNGHPHAPELFYGAALLSIHGVPHMIPNSQKKTLCDVSSVALSAGCRLERCQSGAEGGRHSPKFSEITRGYRTACVRRLPDVCAWDEKKPPACSDAFEPIAREWSSYSRYVLALGRVPETSERLLPVLERWKGAIDAYEQNFNTAIDGGQGAADPKLLPPVLAAGLEARKSFESALWEAQQRVNNSLGAATKLTVLPWMAAWKAALQKTPEVNGFEALQLYDSQVGAMQAIILELAR